MGTFVGHVPTGLFYFILAVWWMYNMFPRYIRSQMNGTSYMSYVSYPVVLRNRCIPLEAIGKTVISIFGFGGGLVQKGINFYDSSGNFVNVSELQHMAMFLAFIVHGVIDVLMFYKVPLPKGATYLSAVLGLSWAAIELAFHGMMVHKSPMESKVHVLPIFVVCACAVAVLVELARPTLFTANLVRIYCMQSMGTWFLHVAFILYEPSHPLSEKANPRWDQSDHRNLEALDAIFGFHLCINMVLMLIFYHLCYRVVKARGPTYSSLDGDDIKEKKELLRFH